MLLLMMSIINESHSALPYVATPPLTYDCVHQEFELRKSGIFYFPAYRYGMVVEDQQCPPFDVAYETPNNIILVEDVTWNNPATPCTDPEICPQHRDDPNNHTCRFGLGGGNPY